MLAQVVNGVPLSEHAVMMRRCNLVGIPVWHCSQLVLPPHSIDADDAEGMDKVCGIFLKCACRICPARPAGNGYGGKFVPSGNAK